MAGIEIIPQPQEARRNGQRFELDERTVVAAAGNGADDLFLAQRVADALVDRTHIGIPVVAGRIPEGRKAILIGRVGRQKVISAAAAALSVTGDDPGPEGYALHADERGVTVVGSDYAGALYGGSTLLELLSCRRNRWCIEGAEIRDRPAMPVRAVHVYVPGSDHIHFFKRYMREVLLRHKFNTMILETSAGTRMRRHPEITAGWGRLCEELYSDGEWVWKYGEAVPLGPDRRFQDSIHRGIGNTGYCEPEELAEICALARRYNIRVIPEVQSLSHVYYIACVHRDLAEIPEARFPDAYCPSNPKAWKLAAAIMDEYIAITGCDALHIGHDEWRAAGLCGRCRPEDTGRLFAEDVIAFHRRLSERNVDLWMWGDHFVSEHNEKGRVLDGAPGVWYDYPDTRGAREAVSAATRERPITITHWSWGFGPQTDRQLLDAGFRVVFGNFDGGACEGWLDRRRQQGVLGAGVSSWCAPNAFEIGKMQIARAVHDSSLLWCENPETPARLQRVLAARLPELKARLEPRSLASQWTPNTRRIETIDLGRAANAPLRGPDWDLSSLAGRSGKSGRIPYAFRDGCRACVAVRRPDDGARKLPGEVVIPVGRQLQGLVFWHATSGPAGRTVHAGDQTFFPRESSDLVAVYEICFADDRIVSVECRYRENIHQWDAGGGKLLYHAPHHLRSGRLPDGRPLVICGHEWQNPRRDIVIESIRMKGCRRRACEPGAPTPAILLLGLSSIAPPRLSDYRGG